MCLFKIEPINTNSGDLGAESIASTLADNSNLPLVCSRVSRLIIDANRPLNSKTLFREDAEGELIKLNSNLSYEERQYRIDIYWKPYRLEIDQILEGFPRINFVLSIHTFTHNYEGEKREMDIGVLFVGFEEIAISVPVFFLIFFNF